MKTGDWAIHDYEIVQVKEMCDGRVTEVSTGMFNTSGRNLECFPLTLRTKYVAETIAYEREKMDKAAGAINLNWPDIHGKLCDFCAEGCRMVMADEKANLEAFWRKVSEFSNEVIDRITIAKGNQVAGINIFR